MGSKPLFVDKGYEKLPSKYRVDSKFNITTRLRNLTQYSRQPVPWNFYEECANQVTFTHQSAALLNLDIEEPALNMVVEIVTADSPAEESVNEGQWTTWPHKISGQLTMLWKKKIYYAWIKPNKPTPLSHPILFVKKMQDCLASVKVTFLVNNFLCCRYVLYGICNFLPHAFLFIFIVILETVQNCLFKKYYFFLFLPVKNWDVQYTFVFCFSSTNQ